MFEEYTSLTAEEAARYCEGTENQPVREEIACRVKESCRNVIEVGCGNGIDAEKYETGRYIGLDVSPALIEAAKRLHPRHFFQVHDAASDRLTRWFAGEPEAIFTKSVLEHTPSIDVALAIFRNMLEAAARSVFVAWHTPPTAGGPKMEQLPGHFGRLVHQNTYPVQPFLDLIGNRPWKITRHGGHELWEISAR